MSDNKYTPKGITGLPLEVAADGEGILTSFQESPRRAITRLMDTRLEYMSREEREAWSRYLVHAANEYGPAIDTLRELIALAKEGLPMSNRLHDAIVKAERGVLSRAAELEDK